MFAIKTNKRENKILQEFPPMESTSIYMDRMFEVPTFFLPNIQGPVEKNKMKEIDVSTINNMNNIIHQ